MRKIFPLLFVLATAIPTSALANDFEAALSSETAQFTFRSDSSLIGWGGADLGFGLFYNEESDYLMQLSLLQARQASQQTPLTLGVGIKAYVGELDNINDDVFGLGDWRRNSLYHTRGNARYRFTYKGTMHQG